MWLLLLLLLLFIHLILLFTYCSTADTCCTHDTRTSYTDTVPWLIAVCIYMAQTVVFDIYFFCVERRQRQRITVHVLCVSLSLFCNFFYLKRMTQLLLEMKWYCLHAATTETATHTQLLAIISNKIYCVERGLLATGIGHRATSTSVSTNNNGGAVDTGSLTGDAYVSLLPMARPINLSDRKSDVSFCGRGLSLIKIDKINTLSGSQIKFTDVLVRRNWLQRRALEALQLAEVIVNKLVAKQRQRLSYVISANHYWPWITFTFVFCSNECL